MTLALVSLGRTAMRVRSARLLFGTLVISFAATLHATELLPWAAKNSVEATYFIAPDSAFGVPWRTGNIFRPSPNARRVFYVTRRGDIECDCNIYELFVYDYARLGDAIAKGTQHPLPVAKVILQSETNWPAIHNARWTDDDHIAFLGAEKSKAPQLHRFSVVSSTLERLSDAPAGVFSFDARGKAAIYLAYTNGGRRKELERYPANFVDGYKFGIVLGMDKVSSFSTMSSVDGREFIQVGRTRTDVVPGAFRYWISPNGMTAVMIAPVDASQAPKSWQNYAPPSADRFSEVSARFQEGGIEQTFSRYEFIDLLTGRTTPIVNAPTGAAIFNSYPAPAAIWSNDSARVVVVNTMLPQEEDLSRKSTAYVVEYDVATRASRSITSIPNSRDRTAAGSSIVDIQWTRNDKLRITRNSAAGVEVTDYLRRSNRWNINGRRVPSVERSSHQHAVRLELSQSVNDPPAVVATGRHGRIIVSSDDILIRDVIRLPVEVIDWTASDGANWHGGLVRPNDKSAQAPLVIQVHQFEADKFQPDGGFYTGFAAQTLAGRGFAVVTMNMMDVRGMGTAEEGASFVRGVDALVAKLQQIGAIDASRVGLVGFSRGGYLTQYALANFQRTKFSAALSFDGADASYVQYLLYALSSRESATFVPQYENQYALRGGFWSNSEKWLAHAPGFNTDRIETPLLLSVAGAGTDRLLMWAMEIFGGMRLNRQPVELLFFPEGQHVRQRPLERQAAMEATVDWLEFWMRGDEDPNPSKSRQYGRWRILRDRSLQASTDTR